MKVRFSTYLGLFVALSIAPAAWGATVQLDGTTATDIFGLDVNGTIYDVSFEVDSFNNLNVDNNFPFLGDVNAAGDAVDAIVAELNSAGALFAGESASLDDINFYVPYGLVSGNSQNAWGKWEVNQGSMWVNLGPIQWNANTSNLVYATFSVVPVPGAVWLFGSALGLLGWLRRK